jgi:hypothetical protein
VSYSVAAASVRCSPLLWRFAQGGLRPIQAITISGKFDAPLIRTSSLCPVIATSAVSTRRSRASFRSFGRPRSPPGGLLWACLHCGHTWTRVDAVGLQDLIENSIGRDLRGRIERQVGGECPACLNTKLVPGRFPSSCGELGRTDLFYPLGLHFSFRSWHDSIPFTEKPKACLKCGHVWLMLDARQLQLMIDDAASPQLLRMIREQRADGKPLPGWMRRPYSFWNKSL